MMKLLESILENETARLAPLLQRALPRDVEKVICEHQQTLLELLKACRHFNATVTQRLKLDEPTVPAQ